ncbi:MAG: transglutaminaseTgpA domain-containing protein [Labilithrix sp.]
MVRWLPSLFAAAVVAVIVAAKPLGPISRAIAIACVIASFGAAAFLRRQDVRSHASVVAGIAAITAAGQVDGGALYGVLVGAFLLVCVACLRVTQRTEATRPEPGRIAVILAITGAIVAVSVLTLPPLAARIERTVTGMFGVDPMQQTAFSTSMMLGATHDLLKSDAIVARIDGGAPEYLRGAVYDRYEHARWVTTMEGRSRTKLPATPGGTIHMVLDKSAPTGSDDLRWFLPPNACGVDHEVQVDAFGVARRVSGDRELRYSTSGCAPAAVRPATTTDLEVDAQLAKTLRPLAGQWTAGATTEREKLKSIERELAKFEYSLDVPRFGNIDPIVDFLTYHKAGHCEFFASTMVLMARTQGIHARVIGGFRVTEINPITHQAIVRDRNAHAWVEAWYDGSWHAWDPTPASEGPGAARSFLDHASDLWALVWERLTSIGPLGYAMILAGIIAVLLAIRSIGRFLARPRRRRTQQAMDRPLPCFETLTTALAAVGFPRDESEPIEAFAERIPSPEIAAALNAYAAFRYGGVGEENAVVRAAERAVKATSSLPRRR